MKLILTTVSDSKEKELSVTGFNKPLNGYQITVTMETIASDIPTSAVNMKLQYDDGTAISEESGYIYQDRGYNLTTVSGQAKVTNPQIIFNKVS
jgi:hypothetical protein